MTVVDSRITCDVIFVDRRKIKKLIRKYYIVEYGEYHKLAFSDSRRRDFSYYITDFIPNTTLIIPAKDVCAVSYDENRNIHYSLLRIFAMYSKKMAKHPTYIMFKNELDYCKWKLSN